MRPIHVTLVEEKWRPAVLLTRESSRDRMKQLTVAPITTRVHGLPFEVPVGVENGLDQACAVSADALQTVRRESIGRQIGWLLDEQELQLTEAISYAFDLTLPDDL